MSRIGSDEARVWARRLHFGDVRAKSVLMAICNYVDEDGSACPSIPTLAEDTDQSPDSVRRRLKDLEDFGVLVRFARWVDENGRSNDKQRGRRTSDELRLALNVAHDQLQAKIDETRALGKAEADPSQQQGSDPSQRDAGDDELTLASSKGQTLATSEGIQSKGFKEEIPPTPLTGGRMGNFGEEQRWAAFDAAFTADGAPIQKPSLARQVLSALTAEESAAATKAAAGYLVYRRSERKPTTKLAAHTFLRERGAWDRYVAFAAGASAARAARPAFGLKPFTRAWWWCFICYVEKHGAALKDTNSAVASWLRMQISKSIKFGTHWVVDPSKIPEVEEAAERLRSYRVDSEHARRWKAHYQFEFNVAMPLPDQAEWVWLPPQLPSTGPPIASSAETVERDMATEGV